MSEIINRLELKDRLADDMDLLVELHEIFVEDSRKILDKLNKAIKSKDFEEARKQAHTIKGSVGNFSATEPYELALKMEMDSKEKNLKNLNSLYKKLEESVSKTINALSQIIEEGHF